VRRTLAPIDGGAGAISSSYCSSCAKDDCVAGISTGVITSAITAIPSRDSLKFIASNSLDHYEKDFARLCPILIQIYLGAVHIFSIYKTHRFTHFLMLLYSKVKKLLDLSLSSSHIILSFPIILCVLGRISWRSR
jgi:hypothetical protein